MCSHIMLRWHHHPCTDDSCTVSALSHRDWDWDRVGNGVKTNFESVVDLSAIWANCKFDCFPASHTNYTPWRTKQQESLTLVEHELLIILHVSWYFYHELKLNEHCSACIKVNHKQWKALECFDGTSPLTKQWLRSFVVDRMLTGWQSLFCTTLYVHVRYRTPLPLLVPD